MSLRSTQEIAAIHALVDQWLWVTEYSEERKSNPWNEGPYNFTAAVRPGSEPPDAKPRLIRQGLLRHAEEALDAIEAAGWQFTMCPAMEFSGRVTLTGLQEEWSSFQHDLNLTLRFQVNKPRAEDALDPERVADAILGFSA